MTEGPTGGGGPRFLRPTAGMPEWIPRMLVMVVVLVVLIAGALWTLQQLGDLLLMLIMSLFLATAFEPGITYLADRGWRRGLAAGAIFLVVLVTAGLILGLMVPAFIRETIALIGKIPDYAATISERLGLDLSLERIREAFAQPQSELRGVAADLAGSILGVGSAVLGTVFRILTIGLFTFYMAADGPRMRRAILSRLRPERQREVLRVWDIAIEKVGGYIYSRVLLAFMSGVASWVAFRIMGLPFAAALAVWVGVLSQFLPVVGTYIAGALPVIIGLLESPGMGLAALVWIVVYQQVENYVLNPKITAHTMSLHPAVAFASAIAGVTMFGAPGALMALPVAATLQAFLSTYFERHEVVESALTEDRRRSAPDQGESRRGFRLSRKRDRPRGEPAG